MLDDVKQKLIQYCEHNFRLKEVKEEVDGDKEYVREVVRKFGTLKGKTYSMDLGTYVFSVSIPIKTKFVDDFVILIKKVKQAVASQTVSAEKVKGLFKEEEGTPSIKVSVAKTAVR